MEKLLYLTKTLSRTKRKDYENYVVNAIWNRVNNPWLVPVTQQYVRATDGHYYFIDLYFPQLNIGIECDEKHHATQKTEDKQRETTIFDVLNQINEADYMTLRVQVYDKSFEEVEEQIEECVKVIKNKMAELKISNGWESFFVDPCEYYKDKKYISIYDNVSFSTNCLVYNTIFGKNYKGSYGKGGMIINDSVIAWFPSIVIEGQKTTWNNAISKDGLTICEYTNKWNDNEEKQQKKSEIGKEKVVFTKVKDPITNKIEYRFVGVFVGKGFNSKNRFVYERVSDKFEIIK
ncbi:MAG: restriction endonuclease [Clostridia bacterium]|nr:restriction endonuclease [Clostridia bacterium]